MIQKPNCPGENTFESSSVESSSESSELTDSSLDESELDDDDVSDVPVVVVAVVAVVPFVVVVMLLSCEPRRDGLRFSSVVFPAGGGAMSCSVSFGASSTASVGIGVGGSGDLSPSGGDGCGSSFASTTIGSAASKIGEASETALEVPSSGAGSVGVLRFSALMLLPGIFDLVSYYKKGFQKHPHYSPSILA